MKLPEKVFNSFYSYPDLIYFQGKHGGKWDTCKLPDWASKLIIKHVTTERQRGSAEAKELIRRAIGIEAPV